MVHPSPDAPHPSVQHGPHTQLLSIARLARMAHAHVPHATNPTSPSARRQRARRAPHGPTLPRDSRLRQGPREHGRVVAPIVGEAGVGRGHDAEAQRCVLPPSGGRTHPSPPHTGALAQALRQVRAEGGHRCPAPPLSHARHRRMDEGHPACGTLGKPEEPNIWLQSDIPVPLTPTGGPILWTESEVLWVAAPGPSSGIAQPGRYVRCRDHKPNTPSPPVGSSAASLVVIAHSTRRPPPARHTNSPSPNRHPHGSSRRVRVRTYL